MYLITGGAGFIGSNLVAALCDRGYSSKIVIVDKLGIDHKWKNIAKHLVYEIITPAQLNPFLADHEKEVEMVFHLGAISSTTEIDVDLVLENNLQLSILLWTTSTATTKPNRPISTPSLAPRFVQWSHQGRGRRTSAPLSLLSSPQQ